MRLLMRDVRMNAHRHMISILVIHYFQHQVATTTWLASRDRTYWLDRILFVQESSGPDDFFHDPYVVIVSMKVSAS